MNTSFFAHTGDLFTSLKILNVNKLYVFNVALHVFKFKDGKCPEFFNYCSNIQNIPILQDKTIATAYHYLDTKYAK